MTLNINRVLNFIDKCKWKGVEVFSTIVMQTICHLKGIVISKDVKFHGLMKFVISGKGAISIGRSSCFRSISTSNLIGINHKCIFSVFGDISSQITIGNNCGFSGTVIGCVNRVTLGNNVRCGANTLITDSDWHLNDSRSGIPKPVKIENNVWLGFNVIVLKGVTIGENSIIGAGSVVTKDIPANVIAAGNPCHVIRNLE